MVNDWLNSLDENRGSAPAGAQAGGDARIERRPDASALGALMHFRVMTVSLIGVGLLLGGGAGLLMLGKPTAQAAFAVNDPRGNDVLREGVTSETSFSLYTAQRAVFASSPLVLGDVSARTGINLSTLEADVTTSVSTDGALVLVDATADSQATALQIATDVVEAYGTETSKDLATQAAAQRAAIEQTEGPIKSDLLGHPSGAQQSADATALAQLEVRSFQAQLDSTNNGTRFVVDAKAVPSKAAAKIIKYAGVGGAVGLLIATVIAFALADQVAGAAAFRRQTRTLATSGRR